MGGEILIRIQKHIFLITLGAASFLGISLAYLGSVLVQYFLQGSRAEVTEPKRAARPAADKETRQFRAFSDFETIITGALIRDSGQLIGADGPGEADASPIVVVGLLAGSPAFAYASIQITGKDGVNEYRVGETVAGNKILRINSNGITVERAGQTYDILIGEKSDEAKAPKSDQSTPGAQKSSISRTQLKKLMQDDKIQREAKIAPFEVKGRMRGLRILALPGNHIFYQLGARPGDIIRRFNGGPLDSTAKLIEIYQNLTNLPKIAVDVERGGKIMSFEFIVTD